MNFTINAEQFGKAVVQAADIATRVVTKNINSRTIYYADMLMLEATQENLCITAYGGTASVRVKIDKTEEYIPQISGVATVNAREILSSLKSFCPTDNLIISFDTDKMKITLANDPQVFVLFTTISDRITYPVIPTIFIQETAVDRQYFVKGLQKVAFAMAEEEKMHNYMCILFEAWQDRMRFSAGSGGRFAITEFESDGVPISSQATKMIIPKWNIANLIRVFKNSCHAQLQIKLAEADTQNGIVEQIILENPNITLALYGLDYFKKYPNMSPILDYNYPYRIATCITDWKYAMEAVAATYYCHAANIHNTQVTADLVEGHFTIQPRTTMQLSKKVNIVLSTSVVDNIKDKNHKPWFRCNSQYLMEMVKKGDKNDIVVISFEDQANLDEIPADQPKQMRLILINYPIKINKEGVKQKSFIFFTISILD